MTVGAQRVSARTHVLACAPPRGGAGRFVSASACVLLGRVTDARAPRVPRPPHRQARCGVRPSARRTARHRREQAYRRGARARPAGRGKRRVLVCSIVATCAHAPARPAALVPVCLPACRGSCLMWCGAMGCCRSPPPWACLSRPCCDRASHVVQSIVHMWKCRSPHCNPVSWFFFFLGGLVVSRVLLL